MMENPRSNHSGMKEPTNRLMPNPAMERLKTSNKAVTQFGTLKCPLLSLLFPGGCVCLFLVVDSILADGADCEGTEELISLIRLSHSVGVIFDFLAGIQLIDSPSEVARQFPRCSRAASTLEKCLPHLAQIISISIADSPSLPYRDFLSCFSASTRFQYSS